jgi:hypothetical protein
MNDPRQALKEDAASLTELFCKLLRSTGMDKGNCEPENRDKLVRWLEEHCAQERFWIIENEDGPTALAFINPAVKEVIGVAVKDGMERNGLGRAMMKFFQKKEPFLIAQPVTRSGKALVQACDFEEGDHNIWRWER